MTKGLSYSQSEKERSWDNNRPLQLGLAFPRQYCNLNCLYCYTEQYKNAEGTSLLSISEIKMVIQEAKNLGVKNVIIPGYGEPFIAPYFWDILEKVKEVGLYALIFTNGSLIDASVAKRLKDLPVSLMVKVNFLDPAKQDMLVGKKGYAVLQRRGIDALVAEGFNETDANGETRLAIHTLICKATVEDVPAVVSWALERNIFPFVEPLFPEGGALAHADILGTPEEIEEIYGPQVKKVLAEKFPDRFQENFGEGDCSQETFSLNLEIGSGGKAVTCFSQRNVNLGSYANGDTLADMWARNNSARRERIAAIDPRSPQYDKNCRGCSQCPGRKKALERAGKEFLIK